jgi:hypothetical protein
MSTYYKLESPIPLNGVELTFLELRRPTVQEVRQLRELPYEMVAGQEGVVRVKYDVIGKYISVCAGLPRATVNLLSKADRQELVTIIVWYFAEGHTIAYDPEQDVTNQFVAGVAIDMKTPAVGLLQQIHQMLDSNAEPHVVLIFPEWHEECISSVLSARGVKPLVVKAEELVEALEAGVEGTSISQSMSGVPRAWVEKFKDYLDEHGQEAESEEVREFLMMNPE